MAAQRPNEEFQRLSRSDQERAHDFAILDEIEDAFKDESPEESTRLATRAVAEARAARRC